MVANSKEYMRKYMREYMKIPKVRVYWKTKNLRWKLNNINKWCAIMDKNQKNFIANNPDYMKKKMLEYYYKHKDICSCRAKSKQALIKLKVIKICKLCGSDDRIQIHHETYPINTSEIMKAIKNNKIYYLCLKCHKILHGALHYMDRPDRHLVNGSLQTLH